MEALSRGKLVIATNVSGAEELLNEDCGVLVNQKSSQEIADALAQFITANERELKKQMKISKQIAEQFDWPVVASRHLQLIEQLENW